MYLLAYNVACAAGWGYVLLACVRHLVSGGGSGEPQVLFDEVEQVLQVAQTAAVMEVSSFVLAWRWLKYIGLRLFAWFETFSACSIVVRFVSA